MQGLPSLPQEPGARRERFLALIEAELQRALSIPHRALAGHYGMMRYHMGWADEQLNPAQFSPGKRLRPLLCLEVCAALGGNWEQALSAAAALELLHNFSLIHDDIEDDSPRRRGRATVWTLWGVPQAVNVGDGMFSLAHLTLEGLLAKGVPSATVLQAMRMLSQTCVALTEGQYLDMDMEDRLDVDLDLYLWMIRNKTAILLGTSTGMGALLAGAELPVVGACTRFGEHLGMAFQIVDDILGTWGDEAITGKSASSDIRERKKTYVVALALDLLARAADSPQAAGCRRLARLYSEPALAEDDIEEVLQILAAIDARKEAEEAAEAYYQMAVDELDKAGLTDTSAPGLRELAECLVRRVG
jgi:geranylgeranyl diphosphate synthase, type I